MKGIPGMIILLLFAFSSKMFLPNPLTQLFLRSRMGIHVQEFKPNTLIINHFIINKNYMVWSPSAVALEFHDVPLRHCFLMLLSTLLARYTKVKYQHKQSFSHEYQI